MLRKMLAVPRGLRLLLVAALMMTAVPLVAVAQPTTGFYGVVSDSADNPVEGAEVIAFDEDDVMVASTETDEAGEYELELAAGTYYIVVDAEGFPVFETEPQVLADNVAIELNITLDDYATVSGTVTALDGGPLAGVAVHVLDNGDMFPADTTGPEGGYLVSELPPGEWDLHFVLEGYDSVTRTVIVASGENQTLNVTMTPTVVVPGTGSFEGTVTVAGTGAPIAGAVVTVAESIVDTTAADGTFEFPELPAGEHPVTVMAEGYVTQNTSILIVAGQTLVREFELVAVTPATGALEGTVTAAATGNPIAGALVAINPDASGPTTVTAADGTYSFPSLPVGDHQIRVSADGFQPQTGTFTIVADETTVRNFAMVAAVMPPSPVNVERVWDTNRYNGSVQIAREFYPGWGMNDIVIVSGEDRAAADPLAAAGLAGVYNAPMFLVSSTAVTTQVKTAINEIKAAAESTVTIHVVGGTTSIPQARLAEIETALTATGQPVQFSRVLATGSRYDLAAQIARRMAAVAGNPGTVLFANGADPSKFFDALALSPIAYHQNFPILLVAHDRVPAATTAALQDIGSPTGRIVTGGPNTVSNAVVSGLNATRVTGGTNRYTNAIAVADYATHSSRQWLSRDNVGLAAVLPDALTGGAAMGSVGGVLLLTEGTRLTPATRAWLEMHRMHIDNAYVFGGPNSVAPDVVNTLGTVLNPN